VVIKKLAPLAKLRVQKKTVSQKRRLFKSRQARHKKPVSLP